MTATGTVLTDLSANLFAALLLILLILLQAGADRSDEGPAQPVEAAQLAAREHTPLDAGALVAALYDRRPEAAGLSIDLTEAEPPLLDAAVRGLDPDLPIRLYVFSHRHYSATAALLRKMGRRWQEISVPPVLGDAATGWTSAFRALLARRPAPPQFRADLAHLLGAAAGPPLRGSGGASDPLTSSMLRNPFGGWLGAVLTIATLLLGFAAVLAIEWIVPRRLPCYACRLDAKRYEGPRP